MRRPRRRRADIGIPAQAIEDYVHAESQGLPMREGTHGAFDLLPQQSQDLVTTLTNAGSFSILTDEMIAAVWEAHRNVFLAAYQRYLPGRRPRGWWLFDSPDEELRVLKHEPFHCPEWEPESTYLRRHGLLTVEEKTALKALPRKGRRKE